jgi:hypothetical protein
LKIVWDACLQPQNDPTSGYAQFLRYTRFLFFVPSRSRKILNMRRRDLKGDYWHVPRKDREKGTPAVIKLPAAAMALIEAQKDCQPYRGAGDDRIWHCRALSKFKKRLDAQIAALDSEGTMKGRWTLHDARRSARSYMGRIKDAEGRAAILPHIAELCLGHKLKLTATEHVYDTNTYETEVGEALALLATYIQRHVRALKLAA